jgi:branched-chain amino acid transport system ATP-binding protein
MNTEAIQHVVAPDVDAHNATDWALEVNNLYVSYGKLKVLEGINMSVAKGERQCIIGPNGAGKTTFFNTIAGVVQPTSGAIRLGGQDVSRLMPRQRAHIGVARTFQRTQLFPQLTVMENLLLAIAALETRRFNVFRGAHSYEQARSHVESHLTHFDLGMAKDRLVGELGYGEQRQIEILMAMIQNPSILLLDEPTAGLAAADGGIVTELLDECSMETTIIMIEHDMDIVFKFASRLSVLSAGAIIADGTVDEVRANATVQNIYLGTQG